MALGPRLDLRHSQSLVMTPQLQQAIKLLALSNLEVEAFIAEELERNPLLEAEREDRGDNDGEPVADSAFGDADFDGDGDGGDLMTADRLLESDDGPGADSPLDVDFAAETFHHDSVADGGPGLDGSLGLDGASSGGSFDDDGTDFDSFAAGGLSLHDHLIAQAGTAFMGTDLLIASHIIDQIDEAGYLPVRLLDITNRLEIPLARGEDILRIIQTFEPTGVGARGNCSTAWPKSF